MQKPRKLLPSEIDCRVGSALKNSKACTILLYKDARVDMQILDEIVGPERWQREHKEVKGVVYCGVGITQEDGQRVIWKWDAGTESNTEPQKGEASDSFKRACVNWGIGRELYTAPYIAIDCDDYEWNGGKPRLRLQVSEIGYDSAGKIDRLVLKDGKGNVRFEYSEKKPSRSRTSKTATDKAEQPATPEEAIPAPTPVPAQLPPTEGYQPLEEERYKKLVSAHAHGETTVKGASLRRWFVANTHAGEKELAQFDEDVRIFKQQHNIQ